jgi:hypothetical protein
MPVYVLLERNLIKLIAVFWGVTPCGSCKNRVSEERIASIVMVTRIGYLRTTLAVTSNRSTLRKSIIFVAPKMNVIRSTEMSVLTRAARRNITEDDIIHNHRRENLKSYIALTGWTL